MRRSCSEQGRVSVRRSKRVQKRLGAFVRRGPERLYGCSGDLGDRIIKAVRELA